jgi:hypothetical protein
MGLRCRRISLRFLRILHRCLLIVWFEFGGSPGGPWTMRQTGCIMSVSCFVNPELVQPETAATEQHQDRTSHDSKRRHGRLIVKQMTEFVLPMARRTSYDSRRRHSRAGATQNCCNGATPRPYNPRLETAPWQIDCRANVEFVLPRSRRTSHDSKRRHATMRLSQHPTTDRSSRAP